MTACQKDLIPQPDEVAIVQKDAIISTTDIGPFLDGPDDCKCQYQILDVVLDNPPTSGAGDHLQFQFYSPELCDPIISTPYFSAFIGDCLDAGLGPETDFFPGGTTNTVYLGHYYFNCDVPRYDVFDLDMNYMFWRLANCNPNFSQLTGTITYRIICEDNELPMDFECGPSRAYGSNIMTSGFTGGSGVAQLNNATRVKLGFTYPIILQGSEITILTEGCGCEPWIEEY